ncbi:hypothetical protein Tco_0327293 [Tanacetum coccineum]
MEVLLDWTRVAQQSIFPTSSAEAEYKAAKHASKEAVWVRKFISGLGVVPTIEEPINMYCDNTRAITITNEFRKSLKGANIFCAKVHYRPFSKAYRTTRIWNAFQLIFSCTSVLISNLE